MRLAGSRSAITAFSDATEIFVFISGYTAAFVYGRAMRQHGFIVASARVLKRAWQIYVAHVFLLAIYLAEIAYVSNSFDNPLYTEEMGVLDFLKNPDVTILQALLLKFKPVNMDILPLYILLLAWFPPMLWLLLRTPSVALLSSASLYALMWLFEWNLPAYPSGTWAFNPFAWQLLFVFGAWCALGGAQNLSRWIHSKAIVGLAFAYLLFAFAITMTWYFPRLAGFVPKFVGDAIYPIDKTNLDVLRIMHFLALAVITVAFVPRDWPALKTADFLASDRVRSAFARNILYRRLSVVCRPFCIYRGFKPRLDAGGRQYFWRCDHGCRCGANFVV